MDASKKTGPAGSQNADGGLRDSLARIGNKCRAIVPEDFAREIVAGAIDGFRRISGAKEMDRSAGDRLLPAYLAGLSIAFGVARKLPDLLGPEELDAIDRAIDAELGRLRDRP